MNVIRIIATILVSVSMAFIFACSEQKTASLEGHEDIVADLQKLLKCLDNPETTQEIYSENAVLKWQDRETGQMNEQKGLNEIENYYKEVGENYRFVKLSINDVKEDANNARVEYQITTLERKTSFESGFNSSVEMVKLGQAWKIKEEESKIVFYD